MPTCCARPGTRRSPRRNPRPPASRRSSSRPERPMRRPIRTPMRRSTRPATLTRPSRPSERPSMRPSAQQGTRKRANPPTGAPSSTTRGGGRRWAGDDRQRTGGRRCDRAGSAAALPRRTRRRSPPRSRRGHGHGDRQRPRGDRVQGVHGVGAPGRMDPVHAGTDHRRRRRSGQLDRGGHPGRSRHCPGRDARGEARSAVRGPGRPLWTDPARPRRAALYSAGGGPHAGSLARMVSPAGRHGRTARLARGVAGLEARPDPGAAPVRAAGRVWTASVCGVLWNDLGVGAVGLACCRWASATTEYTAYNDTEWGRPVRTDDGLYERLTLETFQSGLSWLTILRKREAFRVAFAGFDIEKVACFDDADVQRLLADTGIVRNRAKIEAAIENARAAADLSDGLTALLWSYAPNPRPPRPRSFAEMAPKTAESVAMAKDLKRRGFRFVGPTTAYAMMQATGMVDDHLAGCHVAPS